MPRKVFVAGEILTAADVNTNLMDQAVMVFDDSAARGSAIPTPSEGMVTYLKDTNLVEAYTGAAFEAVSQPGILQVVSATKTDTFSTSSTTFVTITDLSASITPTSASSKILVMVQLSSSPAFEASFGAASHFRIAGGNTSGYVGDTASNRVRSVYSIRADGSTRIDNSMFGLSMVFVDSPATTSATTYSAEMRTNGDAGFVNRSTIDADNAQYGRGASSITLMEVAG